MTRRDKMQEVKDEFMSAWVRNSHLSMADLVKIISFHTDDTDEQFLAALKKFNALNGRL